MKTVTLGLLITLVWAVPALEAATVSRKEVEAALELGRAKIAAGDIAGAVADYTAALAEKKSSASLYYARGEARLAGGDIAGADADYKNAIRLTGEWATPYIGRAEVLIRQKKWRAAQAQLRTALNLEPGHLDARYLLGNIAIEERRFAEAAKILGELAKEVGDDTPASLWLELANAEVLSGNETEAQIAFARYQKLVPELSTGAYLVRAYMRYASADYDSCLLDVARVEAGGRSMLFFRDAITFARRDFAAQANIFEQAMKREGAGGAENAIHAHVLRRAAGNTSVSEKPLPLPSADMFAGTIWQPLHAYLTAAPAAQAKLAEALKPASVEGRPSDPDEIANFHLLAGIAMENDRRIEEARRQYDLAWAQGGTPEDYAWIARQLRRSLK